MSHGKQPISITLSPAQVDDVVREASQGRAPSVLTLISKQLAAPLAPDGGARAEPLPREDQAQEPVFGGYLPRDTEDPRLSRMMAAPPRQAHVSVPARSGDVVLFESWLRHEVATNPIGAERVSISFNYNWF